MPGAPAFFCNLRLSFIFRLVNILKPAVMSGNNSVVECNLAKVEVAGSNPVSRSIEPSPLKLQISQKLLKGGNCGFSCRVRLMCGF